MNDSSNIPKHWQIVELKSISDSIQYGYTESSSKEKIGPKFLRITDIQDNKVLWDEVPFCKIDNDIKIKYLLREGDIVFARTGATVGKSFLIKGIIPEAVFASYLIRVRVNEFLDKNYLSYFFYSLNYWRQITEGQVGIGQPNVNGTKLGQLRIPLPPLSEQFAIVSKIEELLSDLENGKQQLQTAQQQLKVYRQSLLKWAFEGKLTNKDVKDGELPEGWKWVKVVAIGQISTGSTPSKQNSKFYSDAFPFYKPTDLEAGYNVRKASDNLSELGIKEARFLPIDSILVTCIGATIGKTGIIRRAGASNQQINAIIPSKEFNANFIYYQTIAPKFQEAIKDNAAATTLPILNKSKFQNLEMVTCSLEEQQLIVEELESKLTVCDKIEETISQSLQQAETLRQSILKRAFEGRLV